MWISSVLFINSEYGERHGEIKMKNFYNIELAIKEAERIFKKNNWKWHEGNYSDETSKYYIPNKEQIKKVFLDLRENVENNKEGSPTTGRLMVSYDKEKDKFLYRIMFDKDMELFVDFLFGFPKNYAIELNKLNKKG